MLFNLGSPLFATRHDDPKHTYSQSTGNKANYSNVIHMASPLLFESWFIRHSWFAEPPWTQQRSDYS
jgi:hypothetical protein